MQLVASAKKNFVVLYEVNKIYLKKSKSSFDFDKIPPMKVRKRILQSKRDSLRIKSQKLEAVYNNLMTALTLYCEKHNINE